MRLYLEKHPHQHQQAYQEQHIYIYIYRYPHIHMYTYIDMIYTNIMPPHVYQVIPGRATYIHLHI